MSDLNRGIMKFQNADKPIVVGISAGIILGTIIFLLWWAIQSAYVVS